MSEILLRLRVILIASSFSFIFSLIWPYRDATIESLLFVSIAYFLPIVDFIIIWRHQKKFSIKNNPNEQATFVPGRGDLETHSDSFFAELAKETTIRIVALLVPFTLYALINPVLALAVFFLYLMAGFMGVYFIKTTTPSHQLIHDAEEHFV